MIEIYTIGGKLARLLKKSLLLSGLVRDLKQRVVNKIKLKFSVDNFIENS